MIDLQHPSAVQSSLCGNKAATLARLVAKKVPIPAGICITTIESAKIRNEGRVPNATITEIAEKLTPPLAVRSSTTVEDSADRSFAGLFRTDLGISGAIQLRRAILRVVKSVDSSAVSRYCRTFGIKEQSIAISILIQEMPHADVSGVAFSRDIFEESSQVLIEAAPGYGDLLVSGAITPDRFSVSLITGRVTLSEKCRKSAYDLSLSTTVERAVPVDERTQNSLSVDQARRLGFIVRGIEKLLGSPQDVEWLLSKGSFFILQSRPITTPIKRDI